MNWLRFFLLGRLIFWFVLVCSFFIIPWSFEWIGVYRKSDGFVKKLVVIDSVSVSSGDGSEGIAIAYSKTLNYKKVNVVDQSFFFGQESDSYYVWDNDDSDYAYLAMPNEDKFPKKKYFNLIFWTYFLIGLVIVWGFFGLKVYKKYFFTFSHRRSIVKKVKKLRK